MSDQLEAENTPAPTPVRVTIRYPPMATQELKHVNFTRLTHVETEVILDLGNIDDQGLVRSLSSGQPAEVEAFIRFRYGMGIHAFAQLRNAVDELWGKMKEKGLVERYDERSSDGTDGQ